MIVAAMLAIATFVLRNFSGPALVASYATAAIAVLLIGIATLRLVRPPALITLRADGFRTGRIAGAGTRAAQWAEVEKVDTVGGELVIGLTGDKASRVPLGLVASQAAALERDVHLRLNAAHGYRRLP